MNKKTVYTCMGGAFLHGRGMDYVGTTDPDNIFALFELQVPESNIQYRNEGDYKEGMNILIKNNGDRGEENTLIGRVKSNG